MQTLIDELWRGVRELLECPDFIAIAVICLVLGINGSMIQ
jgi:hypothetical protein